MRGTLRKDIGLALCRVGATTRGLRNGALRMGIELAFGEPGGRMRGTLLMEIGLAFGEPG